MYCKHCNLYSDTRECPKCGRILDDHNHAKEDNARYMHMMKEYCKAADIAYIFGIIAAICITGLGVMIAAPIALYFKKKALNIKSSMVMDVYEMDLSPDILHKYNTANNRLEKVRKFVKIALVLFFIVLLFFPVLLGIIINA